MDNERTSSTIQRRISVLLAAPVVAGLIGGCTGAGEPATQPEEGSSRTGVASAGPRLAPDCPPAPRKRQATSARALNAGVAAGGLPAWQAADIGASARLSDGRIVWLFGDTVRTSTFDPRIVANSMLVSSGRCVAQLRDADNGPVIPDVDTSTVRWPMSVAVGRSRGRDVVIVLCSRIRRGNKSSFDFTFLGTSAAAFTVEKNQPPELLKVVDITPDSKDRQQVNWGAAANVHGKWYYVYGTRLTGQKYEFGRELHVARAPVADPGTRSRWQFWDGRRWQPDVERSAVVLGAGHGVSQTLSVDTIGRSFVAISKRDGDLGNFVYKWTAPNPWGPWTPIKELSAPAGFDTGKLEYAPLAHPEIELSSGRLLVSVSRNTTTPSKLFTDPEIGRPLFVEVPR